MKIGQYLAKNDMDRV